MLLFASVLFVVSFTDIESYYIPNAAIIVAVLIRVAYIALQPPERIGALAAESCIGAVAIGAAVTVIVLIMDRVLGRESMGFGDVKLLAVAGFYFGWQQCLFLIIVACIIGLFFAFASMAAQRDEEANDKKLAEELAKKQGDEAVIERAQLPAFPFGPSIAIACWLTMLFGANVISWYMGLL